LELNLRIKNSPAQAENCLKEAVMMKALHRVAFAVSLATLIAVLGSHAKADDISKLTYFTFNQPVEVPGKALPAGTYAFKVLDEAADRNVVQIFNKDMTRLYATVLTVPDFRSRPHDKPIIKFSETAPGAPEAIKEWFYPADEYGQAFVYPKSRAMELAKASNQSVPAMPPELSGNISQPASNSKAPSVTAMKEAQLKSENPNGKESNVDQAFGTKSSK
jgi:hypothetical protein